MKRRVPSISLLPFLIQWWSLRSSFLVLEPALILRGMRALRQERLYQNTESLFSLNKILREKDRFGICCNLAFGFGKSVSAHFFGPYT